MAEALDTTDAQAKDARRWKRELQLAGKREKDWRSDSEKVVKRYRGEEKKRNRFNVLWANTEILRPAIYNSRPNPDVRRRFRDADPIGKAVSEVLERSLSVFVDGDETDDALKNDVLDGLLVGRGVSRVRYVPKIATVPPEAQSDTDDSSTDDDDDGEPKPVDDSTAKQTDDIDADEELESEQTVLEHVDWQDFRHGYGRVWPEVPWVSFRHKLSRNDAEEKFGEEAVAGVQFTTPESDDPKKPEEVGETQKVAEFWEIWDKLGERVFFTQDALDVLLFPTANPEGEPPLEFDGFFPCPRPLSIVENTGSLLPIILFHLYEDQANQLDKLSGRIDKIVNTMRLRGIYDARLSEMNDILSSDDNEMVPVQNAQQWLDGGLDKAVSWVPVEKNAEILESLYKARDEQKAIIDELLGISDIVRGATDPNETLGAQQLKSNYGSVRLQRMQKEVQRYARDIFRLAAATMSQKFSPQTFEDMTELKFPTAAQKAAMVAQMQAQAQAAQQAAIMQRAIQPPPQPAPNGAPGPALPQPMPNGGPIPPHTSPPPQPGAMPPPGPSPQPHPAMGMLPGAPPPGAPGAMAAPPSPPPMPPGLLQMPTWEDILGVIRSDKRRQYKIDVETDSTIAGTMSSDMQGLSQVLQAIAGTMKELAPMVAEGVLPVDAAKEVVMAVIRRARMGMAVEDAFDKMQPPKPPQDPNAGKAAAAMQQVQAKAEADIKVATIKATLDAHVADQQQKAQALQNQQEQALEAQRAAQDHQFQVMDAKFDAMVKIIVATIGATKQADPAVQPIADRTVAGASATTQ